MGGRGKTVRDKKEGTKLERGMKHRVKRQIKDCEKKQRRNNVFGRN